MDLLLYLLSQLKKMAWSMPQPRSVTNKLQKRRTRKKMSEICSRDMFDAVQKSSLGIYLQSQETLNLITAQLNSSESHWQRFSIRNISTISNESTSDYSVDQVHQQNVRRTRPKTPIRQVGENRIMTNPLHEEASELAAVYQSVLPSRDLNGEKLVQHQPLRRLRKVKSQTSLRDLNKDQADEQIKTPAIDSDGDVETLIGSEPISPDSKILEEFWRVPLTRKASYPSGIVEGNETDICLQMCVDLLTNELASALFCHHPIEENNRASQLQILLMIEAYESIQRQIHEKRTYDHVTDYHVIHLEQILENWLKVLYELYENSRVSLNQNFENFEADFSEPTKRSMDFIRAEV